VTENHTRFLQHLEESQGAVWRVASWLNGRGHTTTLSPSSSAPTHGEWKKHADVGDLFIHLRVEVKHLSAKFSCREDWPFRSNFIVCAKHAWDRAEPKPYAFIFLSSDSKSLAVVMGSSSDQWRVEERTDSRYKDVSQSFYLTPMRCVQFGELK